MLQKAFSLLRRTLRIGKSVDIKEGDTKKNKQEPKKRWPKKGKGAIGFSLFNRDSFIAMYIYTEVSAYYGQRLMRTSR